MVRARIQSIPLHPDGCEECRRLDHRKRELDHRALKIGLAQQIVDIACTVSIVVACVVAAMLSHPEIVLALSSILAILKGVSLMNKVARGSASSGAESGS